MNYNHPNRNNSTLGLRLMCAIVFLVFAFGYLYFFQADMLAMGQHVLSRGITRYNRLFGALVITVVLQLLQLLVYALIRLRKRSHALTYGPSMLLLAMLTDVDGDTLQSLSFGSWYWVLPIVLILWVVLAIFAHALQDVEPERESVGLLSRAMWVNMLTMALMIIVVVSIGNTNAVFHYRMRAESLLMQGKYDKALEVGEESLETDDDLQMIRMYALSRKGELGERLFAYPVSGNSTTVLPVEGKSHFAMYPVDSLYRFLGAWPGKGMTTARYLELLQQRDSVLNKRVADYQLCGLLIDKRIDDFARQLCRYHSEGDSLVIDQLPKHYREAMTLYTHLRSMPVIVYHNAVMDEDWDNLQELERQYPDPSERKVKVEEQYRGTYWYYYEYE